MQQPAECRQITVGSHCPVRDRGVEAGRVLQQGIEGRGIGAEAGVPDVEAALQKAESLGGTRRMGPEQAPGANLVVGHFTDPEGHLIGLASVG